MPCLPPFDIRTADFQFFLHLLEWNTSCNTAVLRSLFYPLSLHVYGKDNRILFLTLRWLVVNAANSTHGCLVLTFHNLTGSHAFRYVVHQLTILPYYNLGRGTSSYLCFAQTIPSLAYHLTLFDDVSTLYCAYWLQSSHFVFDIEGLLDYTSVSLP